MIITVFVVYVLSEINFHGVHIFALTNKYIHDPGQFIEFNIQFIEVTSVDRNKFLFSNFKEL